MQDAGGKVRIIYSLKIVFLGRGRGDKISNQQHSNQLKRCNFLGFNILYPFGNILESIAITFTYVIFPNFYFAHLDNIQHTYSI
jgi:hypothetical protein